MRLALTFSTRREKSSQYLWQTCCSSQYIEQFFIHRKQLPRTVMRAKPSLNMLSRLTSTLTMQKEEEVSGRETFTKNNSRILKNMPLDALITFLSTHKLTDREIFATLRAALYNITQSDHKKAWLIYHEMIQYKVDIFLKPNHYGILLNILKNSDSTLNLLEVIENMKKHSTPSHYHYSQVLYALSKQGLGRESCEFIQSILEPTSNHYHSLVVAVKNSKDIDERMLKTVTEQMLEGMLRHNVELDSTTRALTISLLADYKQANLIIDFIKAVDNVSKKEHRKGSQPYTAYMYTSLIAGCARRMDSVGAKSLYKEMKKNKLKPNQVTYTALMEAYGRAGDFTSAIRLLTSYQHQYKKVHKSMLGSLVVSALRHDNLLVAENTMEFMAKKRVKLEKTDKVLRAAILWLKTRQDMIFARKYFDKLYTKDKTLANSVMTNHPVKVYSRIGDRESVVDICKKQSNSSILLINQEKVKAKHHSSDALFHCRDVPAAVGIFVSMRNQAMSDEITMAMIIKGLVLNNEGDLAWKLFKTLQPNGTKPNLNSYTNILKSLSASSSSPKKRPNINMDKLHPRLLKAVDIQLKGLDFQHLPIPTTPEELQLFCRLTGFNQPNVYIYTTLISCFAKNDIYQAFDIFEHMCRNCVHPTVETYTVLLQGCAIFKNSDLAFTVFKHMNEKQVEPKEITWQYLLKSLEKDHMDKRKINTGEFARMSENKTES